MFENNLYSYQFYRISTYIQNVNYAGLNKEKISFFEVVIDF